MSKFSVPWLSLYLIILKFSSCTSIFFETVMTIVTFPFVKMCMTRELLRFSLVLVCVINGVRPENFFRTKLHDLFAHVLTNLAKNEISIFASFLVCVFREEYRTMKLQWQSMTQTQEKNFAEFRERKQLIGKLIAKLSKDRIIYVSRHQKTRITFIF